MSVCVSRRTFSRSPERSRRGRRSGRKMGVEVVPVTPGDGCTFPKAGQIVAIHYTGTIADSGKNFDSSRDRGTIFKFRIGKGEVLKGWDDGITQMSLGERAKLIVTPDMAYGKRGYPGVIPPDATLIFDIELLSLE